MTVTGADIAGPLNYRETSGKNSPFLSFSYGSSGPSFGAAQLDIGSGNTTAINTFTTIMLAAGFTSTEITSFIYDATQIRSIQDPSAKQAAYINLLGGSDPTVGEAVLTQINSALQNNSNLINSSSSADADTIAALGPRLI